MSGIATIKATPDQAIVGLGVQTQANTAQGALLQNAIEMTALIAALTAKGIAKDDIATSYVSIYPTYGNSGMDITGYQATNQVDVTVHDISTVGEVIDDGVDGRREPHERHHVPAVRREPGREPGARRRRRQRAVEGRDARGRR